MPALLGNDHFQYVGFGERWEQLGDSLRDRGEPEWAAIAYAHADRHYYAYAEAWREHLPSSRFDDDGGAYLAPLHAKREALPKAPPAGSPLTWLHALCLEQIEAAASYVKDLVVRPDWRGRGLGKALMYQTFGEFKRRGLPRVTLKTDSNNPTDAWRLYERVGMRIERTYEIFQKGST